MLKQTIRNLAGRLLNFRKLSPITNKFLKSPPVRTAQRYASTIVKPLLRFLKTNKFLNKLLQFFRKYIFRKTVPAWTLNVILPALLLLVGLAIFINSHAPPLNQNYQSLLPKVSVNTADIKETKDSITFTPPAKAKTDPRQTVIAGVADSTGD